MPTYSKKFLQTYRQNINTINMCDQIEKQVLQKALRGETRCAYTWTSHKNYPVGNGETIETEKVVSLLKERFPDCLVEYQEIKNIHGKVESGIVIDWT